MSKPYTNYNAKHDPVDLGALVGLMAAKRAACARGEHEDSIVTARYVTYAPGGRRRPNGERYCRRCFVVLPADVEDPS